MNIWTWMFFATFWQQPNYTNYCQDCKSEYDQFPILQGRVCLTIKVEEGNFHCVERSTEVNIKELDM